MLLLVAVCIFSVLSFVVLAIENPLILIYSIRKFYQKSLIFIILIDRFVIENSDVDLETLNSFSVGWYSLFPELVQILHRPKT